MSHYASNPLESDEIDYFASREQYGSDSNTCPSTKSPDSIGSGSISSGSSERRNIAMGKSGGHMDRACQPCRTRKVKCDRQWPRCSRCTERNSVCNFSDLVLATTSLSSIPEDFKKQISDFESRIRNLEAQLAQANLDSPAHRPTILPHYNEEYLIGDTIQRAFPFTAESARLLKQFFARQPRTETSTTDADLESVGHDLEALNLPSTNFNPIGRRWDWERASPALARALSIHLIGSFFETCCSFLPVFDPFHSKLKVFADRMEVLDTPDRIIVHALCALGARSTPHSAIFGTFIPAVGSYDYELDSTGGAGKRREAACQTLTKSCLALLHQSEVTHEPSITHLETLLVLTQMMIFEELQPRQSLSLVRSAFALLKDLFYAEISAEDRSDCIRRCGIPLLTADSVIAAYAKRPPTITESDIDTFIAPYVIKFPFPTFGVTRLSESLDSVFDEPISHDTISTATTIMSCWLAQCQREFGRMSAPNAVPTAELPREIYRIWLAIDEIHNGCQRIQKHLVNLADRPLGCCSEECSHLHLRYDTRLDRELMDIAWLTHGLIEERFANSTNGFQQGLKQESMKRVRKSLKLIAFYAQLFLFSRNLHMTYHLVWQLELLPGWTELCLQRFGESGGPEEETELSEIELDWLHKALHFANYYHPVAADRLKEFRQRRRAARDATFSTTSSHPSFLSLLTSKDTPD